MRVDGDARRGDAILLREGKLRQTLENAAAKGQRDPKDGIFQSIDENRTIGESSRFVIPKDFEGNRYHLIAVSVE